MCSYDAPGVKIGPALGVARWNKTDQLQNSSSLKLEGMELGYLVCSIS